MEVDALRDHCLSKPEVTEGFPFGPEVLVFKVAGKMFATLSIDAIPPRMNLKCDPDEAVARRARWASVEPGYHMNKRHWNTIISDGSIPDEEVRSWIDDSYRLVVRTLRKADRERLQT